MKLLCIESTKDGRLTRGTSYTGQFIYLNDGQLRFLTYDNKSEWMTFNTKVFKPAY
jgi:hypothetical protein